MTGGERGLLRDRNLYVVFAITLMVVLGVSSVAPAFPRIQRAFDISDTRVGLLITAFTIPGVFLTPVLGLLADRWGRKRILIPSLVLFALAGGACALARDFELLLVLRLVQGIGAAPLGALNLTLIADLYDERRRAAAMGYNASALSIGTASYPFIGGALALIGWYAPFALALVALPVALAVWRGLDLPESPAPPASVRSYLGGVARTLRDGPVLMVFAISVATFVLLYGAILTYLPVLMDERFAASSLVIGTVTASMSVMTGLTSSQLGRLSSRFRPRTLIAAGFLFYGIACALFPLAPSTWWLLVPAALFGIGQGLNLPSALTLLTELIPAEQRAAILSLNGTVLRLGQTLGPVVMGAAWALGAARGTYGLGVALALSMAALAAIVLRRAPARSVQGSRQEGRHAAGLEDEERVVDQRVGDGEQEPHPEVAALPPRRALRRGDETAEPGDEADRGDGEAGAVKEHED